MKFFTALATLLLATQARAGEIQVGTVRCYLTASEKKVNVTLTEFDGFGFPEVFREEVLIPIKKDLGCHNNPDMCEGAEYVEGAFLDVYKTIRGEKVRYVMRYMDGYISTEVRVNIAAAYAANTPEELASLQYGGLIYTLACHKK